MSLLLRVKQRFCHHEFAYEDLAQTGIAEPEKPASIHDYASWQKWYEHYYESDHVKKRVCWPCDKCWKVFYAHCGLDIMGTHGRPFSRRHRAANQQATNDKE
jgi:hypothetical protein